jgi:hypothetical protein
MASFFSLLRLPFYSHHLNVVVVVVCSTTAPLFFSVSMIVPSWSPQKHTYEAKGLAVNSVQRK